MKAVGLGCERRDLTLALRCSVIRGHNSPPDCYSVPLVLQAPLFWHKKNESTLMCELVFGARDGTWTRTGLPHAPQTCASADSATLARTSDIIAKVYPIVNTFFKIFLKNFFAPENAFCYYPFHPRFLFKCNIFLRHTPINNYTYHIWQHTMFSV